MTGPRPKPDRRSRRDLRLKLLRDRLRELGLSGFVVPTTDAFQGEYTPPSAARLQWLTGFSGSAGLAVVLADDAALFVDGRYTLQARAEVDGALYTHCHHRRDPPDRWIKAHLPAGGRLGVDPWLHTQKGLAPLRQACRDAGGELVDVEDNPIDFIWEDRPPPPNGPGEPFDLAHSGESSTAKRKRLAASLGEAQAAVISAPDSVAWLLNMRGSDLAYTPLILAFAILSSDSQVSLFLESERVSTPLREHLGPDVTILPPAQLGAALDALGAQKARVRVDQERTARWIIRRLEDAGAMPEDGPDPCALPKARKNDTELNGIRAAHRRDGAALTRFLCWLTQHGLKEGVTELSAAQRLEQFRRGNDHYRSLSFPTISGSGPNGAVVHYRVDDRSDRPLAENELYLVDSGAQYLDGTTDVTRTVALGPPGAEERENYTRVLKGHIALASARFPQGTTGAQLDVLGRRALWEIGLDYDHGTGHGVGHFLSVHEGPQRIAKTADRVALEAGMVLSNEPGYYKEGAYGIRIENLQAVRPVQSKGDATPAFFAFEVLTLCPLDRSLIDAALLSPGDIAWVDAYHRWVRDALSPLLDGEASAWLTAQTERLA